MLSNIKINFTDTENFTTFVGIKKRDQKAPL